MYIMYYDTNVLTGGKGLSRGNTLHKSTDSGIPVVYH